MKLSEKAKKTSDSLIKSEVKIYKINQFKA
jgi:hypothetical protein